MRSHTHKSKYVYLSPDELYARAELALVLGGDVLEFGDRHFEMFKKEFLAMSLSSELGKPPVVQRSMFGRRGVAVGGAQIILDSLVQ